MHFRYLDSDFSVSPHLMSCLLQVYVLLQIVSTQSVITKQDELLQDLNKNFINYILM